MHGMAMHVPEVVFATLICPPCDRSLTSSLQAAGQIQPLPATTWPLSEAPAALRQLSAAKHIGKVVVQVGSQRPAAIQRARQAFGGAWAVTGGLGGLGSLAGRWLAGQGTTELTLLGRTG